MTSLESLECSLCKLCIDACEPGEITLNPVKELVAMASEEIQKRADDLDAKLAELA